MFAWMHDLYLIIFFSIIAVNINSTKIIIFIICTDNDNLI